MALLNTTEASRVTGLTGHCLSVYANTGRIPAVKDRGRWLFHIRDLRRYNREHRRPGRTNARLNHTLPRKRKRGAPRYVLPQESLAQLGKRTDYAIARDLGVSEPTVRRRRYRAGIASARFGIPPPNLSTA